MNRLSLEYQLVTDDDGRTAIDRIYTLRITHQDKRKAFPCGAQLSAEDQETLAQWSKDQECPDRPTSDVLETLAKFLKLVEGPPPPTMTEVVVERLGDITGRLDESESELRTKVDQPGE